MNQLHAFTKWSGLALSCALLAGCASPAMMENMRVTDPPAIAADSPVRAALQLAPPSGGKKTNPAWTSQVDATALEAALTESLRNAGLLANGTSRYTLHATLISLDQPLFGFDMKVTSTANYTLTDAGGHEVWRTMISTPFTATTSDAFAGVKRLRIANEGSIRTNIRELLEQLSKLRLAADGVNLK